MLLRCYDLFPWIVNFSQNFYIVLRPFTERMDFWQKMRFCRMWESQRHATCRYLRLVLGRISLPTTTNHWPFRQLVEPHGPVSLNLKSHFLKLKTKNPIQLRHATTRQPQPKNWRARILPSRLKQRIRRWNYLAWRSLHQTKAVHLRGAPEGLSQNRGKSRSCPSSRASCKTWFSVSHECLRCLQRLRKFNDFKNDKNKRAGIL